MHTKISARRHTEWRVASTHCLEYARTLGSLADHRLAHHLHVTLYQGPTVDSNLQLSASAHLSDHFLSWGLGWLHCWQKRWCPGGSLWERYHCWRCIVDRNGRENGRLEANMRNRLCALWDSKLRSAESGWWHLVSGWWHFKCRSWVANRLWSWRHDNGRRVLIISNGQRHSTRWRWHHIVINRPKWLTDWLLGRRHIGLGQGRHQTERDSKEKKQNVDGQHLQMNSLYKLKCVQSTRIWRVDEFQIMRRILG